MKKFIGFVILTIAVSSLAFAQPALPVNAPIQKGTIRTFATGINNQSITIDPFGNIWVASPIPQAVTEVAPSGAVLRVINQLAAPNWLPGQWAGPFSIASDPGGNIWVTAVVYTSERISDGWGHFHRMTEVHAIKIAPTGLIAGNFSVANSFTDEWIPKILADPMSNVFISSSSDRLGAGVISKLDGMGIVQGIVKISSRIYGLAIDRANGNTWGSNTMSDDIYGISPTGAMLGPINTHHASTGIAIDQTGNFWVGGNAHEIEKISPSGEILVVTPIQNNTGDGPRVVKVDGAGNVWAVNQSNQPNQSSAVIELNPQGTIIATYPMPNATDLAIDKHGNVWVVNTLSFGNNLYEIIGVATGPQYSP